MSYYFIKVKAILILLYSVQGIVFNFLLDSLVFIQKQELNYSQIGMIKICSYPFSLKLLWSPLVDSYYFKFIGRRKTWILPCQIVLIVFLYYLYLKYEDIMRLKDVFQYSVICFFILFLLATQDIALDGWALTICRENSVLASATQTIGHKVGGIMSLLVFLQLNSVDFCNKWIYSESHSHPFLTPTTYFLFLTIYVIVATLLALVFPERPVYKEITKTNIEEKEVQPITAECSFVGDSRDMSLHTHTQIENLLEDSEGLIETLKNLLKIAKLKHFKKFVFYLIIHRAGMFFFYSVTGLILIDKGFPKETIALISSILIPFEIIAVTVLEKKKEKFFLTYNKLFDLRIIVCIIELLFICYYKEITEAFDIKVIDISFIIVLVLSICNSIVDSLMCCCLCGFYNSITDLSVGATYITLLYSLNNLSGQIPSYFVFALVDYIGYQKLGLMSIIYSIIISSMVLRRLIEIEDHGKSIWKIKEISSESKEKNN